MGEVVHRHEDVTGRSGALLGRWWTYWPKYRWQNSMYWPVMPSK
ncbi:hypothetical protein AB0K12_39500 [Nonomuraea sp. NPDC049419]